MLDRIKSIVLIADETETRFTTVIDLVQCKNCTFYQGECCVRFGRQEHPHRDPEDYCSKGEKK